MIEEKLFKCLTPLEISVKLQKINNAVIGDAVVNTRVEFFCARCSEPIEQDRKEKLDLYFEVDPSTEYIDIGEDIRQELFIDFSSIVLCKQSCKGICPVCGVNFNNQACRCKIE